MKRFTSRRAQVCSSFVWKYSHTLNTNYTLPAPRGQWAIRSYVVRPRIFCVRTLTASLCGESGTFSWCGKSDLTSWCGGSGPISWLVNLVPPVCVVNLAQPVGVVNLAIIDAKTGNSWTNHVRAPVRGHQPVFSD